MRAVLIPDMDKPRDCTECPICDEHDECMLLPMSFDTWDEQYSMCPLVPMRSYRDYLDYLEKMEAIHG